MADEPKHEFQGDDEEQCEKCNRPKSDPVHLRIVEAAGLAVGKSSS